jgi:hypothetical protein
MLLTCSYQVLLQHLQKGLQQWRLQDSVGDYQGGHTKASLQDNSQFSIEARNAHSSR